MNDSRTYETREEFCEAAMRAFSEKVYRTYKEFARRIHIAPDTAHLLIKGTYPGVPGKSGRWGVGRVATTTRICDELGLDLEAALVVCNLPWMGHVIERARQHSKTLVLNESDLKMLLQQIELIGPIPYTLVPQLVNMFREKKKE